jgi:hypothetical protein
MNHETIRTALKEYDSTKVSVYINYLKTLESEDWMRGLKEEQMIDFYKKVAIDNLYIDGTSITIQYKKGIMISYDYHAYKNKVLNAYPESVFDHQLIYQYADGTKDDYTFHKESGKVIYSHKIKDPFAAGRIIIGAYCVIKNSRGEFLETINREDIEKFKQTAKMQAIWKAWEDRMVLKSVIKRTCSANFYDIVQNIEKLDNENYSPENVNLDALMQIKVEGCKTFADLNKLYKDEEKNVTDKNAFLTLCAAKKKELMEALPELTDDDWMKVVAIAKQEGKLDKIKTVWKITEDQEIRLKQEAAI